MIRGSGGAAAVTLKGQVEVLQTSKSKVKQSYEVPKRNGTVISEKRRDRGVWHNLVLHDVGRSGSNEHRLADIAYRGLRP